MDNNERKISTSIQYQISNVVLFNEIFGNWGNFKVKLNKGPEKMKKYLFNMWNKLRENLKNNTNLIVKDIDKDVTVSDFNVTFNKTKNGTNIYFITFPNYDYFDAASKYVALALTPIMPKYYTLEYSEYSINHTQSWFVGEFTIENSKKKHINHGTSDNMRLSWFAGYILGKLELENL